jgi:uncharacterized membrane-anchored protein YhcB (DUF1043 family)
MLCEISLVLLIMIGAVHVYLWARIAKTRRVQNEITESQRALERKLEEAQSWKGQSSPPIHPH